MVKFEGKIMVVASRHGEWCGEKMNWLLSMLSSCFHYAFISFLCTSERNLQIFYVEASGREGCHNNCCHPFKI